MTLACVTDGDFRVVIALYRKLKPRLTPVCYNQLLQSLATSSNLLCEMKRVYADVSSPSVGTSNIMISAYCRHGYVVESNQYLCKMIHSGFTPDLSTFKSLIMGYSRINEVDAALGVFHTNMVQHPDLKCYQQLTMGLCAADKLGIAQRLLDQIQGLDQMDEMQGPRRRMVFEQLLTQHEYEEAANIVEDMICSRHVVDLKDCKTLICGLFEHGKKERAIQVFYKLLQCDCYYDDEIAWTILIRGVLRKHGLAGAFSQLFQAMRKSGSHLSPQTRLALIRGLRRKTVPTLVQ
ncbi:unnamed protein product [Thlaspi arvense]|uniref:Pentatricopeptide repeat-containing protein n=1 Tax=Thlaspi arvense TaxID=13288 RepID=A0AAU9RCN7_THLAR|nr:unnamed protein product [Thlaspi arvense]